MGVLIVWVLLLACIVLACMIIEYIYKFIVWIDYKVYSKTHNKRRGYGRK